MTEPGTGQGNLVAHQAGEGEARLVRVSRPASFGSGFFLYEERDGQFLRVGSADTKDQVYDFILHRDLVSAGMRG